MTEKNILALGFFDGVHKGHQALLSACRTLAKQHGATAGVVTFDRHPGSLISGRTTALINSAEDRSRLLRDYGMERVAVLPFDAALKEMPWQRFFSLLREQYGAAGLVCGDDFRFGQRGQGNALLLEQACRQAGIPCTVIPEQTVGGIRVSSTHIRGLLEAGRMGEALDFLGHPHRLSGRVVEGRSLGRTMGIPTANLQLPAGVICPMHGVYACKAHVEGQTYLAVTNVGLRPTVGGHHVTVEPWLLDFEGDLYGKLLALDFYSFLRPERKFGSLEDLRGEIRKNAEQTREFFCKK